MPQGTARSSPPLLLPDVRVVLLGEKHGVIFGLQLGGGSLCSTLSPALQHDVIALGRGNRVAYNNNLMDL